MSGAIRPLSILVVDDEKVQRETLAAILRDHSHTVTVAQDAPSAFEALSSSPNFDVVLTDFRMPGGSGIDVARRAADLCPQSVTLMMTAYADVDSVIEAMRIGVLDYLLKPLKVEGLLTRLELIRERQALKAEVNFLRAAMSRLDAGEGLLGQSPCMTAVQQLIGQVAETRGTVLITGESGTGKEVVARQIHRHSTLTKGQFVAINCGAVPENLLESELFGHKKGAFTGALADKPGLFAVANEGTLFLDEIGEMPKSLQVKLLRVLQEREVVPVGDTRPLKVNLRVIAATNRDLASDVASGLFRQDLYYRINVVEVRMPPLRERPEDIPLLVRHFIEKYTRELRKPMRLLSNEACRRLVRYPWPGNVRELENIIERAIILSKNIECIDIDDLPLSFQRGGGEPEVSQRLEDAVKQFSRSHILGVLATALGDKKDAARLLGMSLSSLYRKLEELEIPK